MTEIEGYVPREVRCSNEPLRASARCPTWLVVSICGADSQLVVTRVALEVEGIRVRSVGDSTSVGTQSLRRWADVSGEILAGLAPPGCCPDMQL